MDIVFALIILVGLAAAAGIYVIRNLYYICQPNEVLIFAGGTRRVGQRRLGYRIVKGGSGIRIPLLERVSRMDLTNIIIDLQVSNAYCKGGIPLKVEGVANLKIAGEEPAIHNAIERFLGKSRAEITRIAKETLEGNLRGVLASLTPEQVNEDKMAFAESLLEEAEEDLNKIGLTLDTLKIQNISDDVQYLNSIGRKKSAELLRDARIAEARAKAESIIRAAENEQNTAFARVDAEIEMAKAEAQRRILDATTKREAMVAEAEAQVAAQIARTKAEVAVQQARIEQVRRQLEADVVVPADADCKRKFAEAKGQAARIVEDGKAMVEGLRKLIDSWKAAGPNAREIFLYQKLEVLLATLVETVQQVKVDELTVIDARDGTQATRATAFLEQLRQAAGIDVAAAVRALAANKPAAGTAGAGQGGHAPEPTS